MTLALLNTTTPEDILSIKYLVQRELDNFELSINMTILELSLKYNCDIYIQGSKDRRWESHHKRFINAFSGGLSGYRCRHRATSLNTVIINHDLGSLTGVYDFCNEGKPTKKIYKDDSDNILARLDADNNIWFCDFYHQDDLSINVVPFSGFHEILLDAWGESVPINIVKLLHDSISPLDPNIIVRIESKFDKDAYIKEVENRYQEAIGLQGCIQSSRILSLTTVLASERMAREKTIAISSATSFAQGVTFARKNDGWEFKDGRLYWKKRIEMKHCNYYDRSWELPDSEIGKYFIEGLNFIVSPKPTQASAEKHYHPNVSGSGSVCIGDLQGRNLSDILEKLPSLLETGGLTHPFDQDKTWDIISLIVNKKGEFPKETCKINKKWNVDTGGRAIDVITIPTPDQVLSYLETRSDRAAATPAPPVLPTSTMIRRRGSREVADNNTNTS